MKIIKILTFLTLIFSTMNASAKELDLENTLYIDLKYGRVVIELFPKIAPKHVERIKLLARQKFYDGIVFHRVIDGFMAQTGDPTGTGMGGSKLPDLRAEFSDEPHIRGVEYGQIMAAREKDKLKLLEHLDVMVSKDDMPTPGDDEDRRFAPESTMRPAAPKLPVGELAGFLNAGN